MKKVSIYVISILLAVIFSEIFVITKNQII
jgi:hypothetical protein